MNSRELPATHLHAEGGLLLAKLPLLVAAVWATTSSAQVPHAAARASVPVCAPASATGRAGHVRIDGWFGAGLNDSLVIVVDGTERWRGLFRLCSEAPASASVSWLPTNPDSMRNVVVIKGDTVRTTYRIGGLRPSALIVETRRTH
jgi:hypothetical protein